ncbi:hypothetical protein PM082_007028 [Marasmius tenuissimus]|nr:hypothetical protein PM082_007028 [Marasmius tenuissimus]
MSFPNSQPCGQPSSSSDELGVVHIGRDQNVNIGPGSLIVNNDNKIFQQTRPIRWYIQGDEEEETEYDQRHWGCREEELWIDGARGVICRGPEGPYGGGCSWCIEVGEPVATVELLKPEVLVRYLASFKAWKVDEGFVGGIKEERNRDDVYVPDSVDRPMVFCALTNTPIAVANTNIWTSRGDSLEERTLLGNGWTRYQLNRHAKQFSLCLTLNVWVGRVWISQALSIFHTRGISLEEDLSVYQLVVPEATLIGELSASKVECKHRLRQPIYLFLRQPPLKTPECTTSSLHYWSFFESGRPHLSPEVCNLLGLPAKLRAFASQPSCSWPTSCYKLTHQYQHCRGFDPATADFAQHLYGTPILFRPLDDSDRFEVANDGVLASPSSY